MTKTGFRLWTQNSSQTLTWLPICSDYDTDPSVRLTWIHAILAENSKLETPYDTPCSWIRVAARAINNSLIKQQKVCKSYLWFIRTSIQICAKRCSCDELHEVCVWNVSEACMWMGTASYSKEWTCNVMIAWLGQHWLQNRCIGKSQHPIRNHNESSVAFRWQQL